jgi:glucose-6-phosphate isomerase
MLSDNLIFKNFKSKKKTNNKNISKNLKTLLKFPNEILSSMDKSYKDTYNKKLIHKFKKINTFRLIGMGGSILGAKAIYNFLKPKLKIFSFVDNFSNLNLLEGKKKKITLIVSKSGNTLETISNLNVLINKNEKNLFITENKKSYLMELANILKSEIVHHNNFIGGRFSVLSEVGMLPAQLMGFKPEKFRRLNILIKDKRFINSLIQNVSNILYLSKKKNNSIILNYDDKSNDFFSWYQQLVAESLGKKNKGILPMISVMPRDNHSLMQHYLDGKKNNFYTFFFVKDKNSRKIKNNDVLKSHYYIKNRSLNEISFSQFLATERVFKKKDIPYRSFIVKNRNEETLGELFTFFMLETILLGMALEVNPYDQPSVELIKKNTTRILKHF